MSLLAFDLIKMEEKLTKNVNDFFKWEKILPYEVEKDWRAWNKMMGAGTTDKARSTRKCLDSKRRWERKIHKDGKGYMGNKSLIGVRL